jgi:hypothetical protein
MIPIAESRWSAAESAATVALAATTGPDFMRSNAITSLASAKAAEGKIAEADSLLSQAVKVSRGASARWYERAQLELRLSQGTVQARRDLLPGDTSATSMALRAVWSAIAGDTTAARKLLERTTRLATPPENVDAVVNAWIDIHAGRPRDAAARLASAARTGEHDPLSVDRPDNFLLRWSTAVAYERAGQPDSAIAFLQMLVQPKYMPPSHMALRGFLVPAAEAKMKQLQVQGRR